MLCSPLRFQHPGQRQPTVSGRRPTVLDKGLENTGPETGARACTHVWTCTQELKCLGVSCDSPKVKRGVSCLCPLRPLRKPPLHTCCAPEHPTRPRPSGTRKPTGDSRGPFTSSRDSAASSTLGDGCGRPGTPSGPAATTGSRRRGVGTARLDKAQVSLRGRSAGRPLWGEVPVPRAEEGQSEPRAGSGAGKSWTWP